MKFLHFPLFLLVALSGLAASKSSSPSSVGTQQKLESRMKNGQFDKRTLMRGAKPYDEATKRRLENNQNSFEINGDYSVSFDSCFSLRVQNDDLFNDDVLYYANSGEVVSEKSYVLFNVCYTQECYYEEDNAKMTFITDIATFFEAFSSYLPDKVERYCEGCQANEDYCNGKLQAYYEQDGEGDGEQGDDANQGDNNQRRSLGEWAKNRRIEDDGDDAITEYIDCDQCYEFGCIQDYNYYYYQQNKNNNGDGNNQNQNYNSNGNPYDFEYTLEWMEELTRCFEIEQYKDDDSNPDYFAGLICNEDGDGVEIGIFLDDECTLYTTRESYASVTNEYDQVYTEQAQELVKYMFTHEFNCYQPEIQYTNPYAEQYAAQQQQAEEEDAEQEEAEEEEAAEEADEDQGDGRKLDDNNNNQNNGYYYYEPPEAAEYCRTLFEGEMEALNLYDCGGYQQNGNNNNNNGGDDDFVNKYDWYSYDIPEDAEDYEVCKVVQSMQGEYSTLYDTESSGTLFNYKDGNRDSGLFNERKNTNLHLNVGEILAITAGAVLACMCLSVCYCCYCCKSSKVVEEREQPLVLPDKRYTRRGIFVRK